MNPYMLVMRAMPHGCIWQAYEVRDEQEALILERNAQQNGFFIERQPLGYTEETSPGWRDTPDWAKCLEGSVV